MMFTLKDAVAKARTLIEREPDLAAYMVRDYQELRQWGLDSLAWMMCREGAARGEVVWLLDEIDKRIAREEATDDTITR